MIKVLVADDHAVVRKGFIQILSDEEDICVAGEAACGREVFDFLDEKEADIVLLDINMPGMSGIDVLKRIRTDYAHTAVLIVTIYPEEQYAFRSIKAGAAGYITKESAPEELISAIRKIASGHRYITPQLAEKLALYLETDTDRPLHHTLSDREYEVMLLLASGKRVKQIAEELCLSVKTISTYRKRILDKMKITHNSDLISYALRHNLLT